MSFVSAPNKDAKVQIERMILHYGDSLLRICFMYLKDRSLAEDALQETFLKAYKHFDQFRGEAAEKTWLMRIAMNTCKDIQRSAWFHRVDRKVALDTLPEPSENTLPQDDTVIEAIMALHPKYKTLVLLRYYQDMSIAEIAETMGIPKSTVTTRLKKAKEELGRRLEGWYME